jgi:hypothetical protein
MSKGKPKTGLKEKHTRWYSDILNWFLTQPLGGKCIFKSVSKEVMNHGAI